MVPLSSCMEPQAICFPQKNSSDTLVVDMLGGQSFSSQSRALFHVAESPSEYQQKERRDGKNSPRPRPSTFPQHKEWATTNQFRLNEQMVSYKWG